MADGADRRQEFLDLLKGGQAEKVAPAGGPAEPVAAAAADPAEVAAEVVQPEPEPAVAPTQAAEGAESPAPDAAPLSFEQEPPPAEEVPAALSALAGGEEPAVTAGGAPLMDLGHDAQMQGTAIGLHSIAQRLEVVAAGLNMIPILAGVARDLEHLNYGQAAAAVDALVEWAQDEEKALLSSLEQRGSARRGDAPA